LSDTFNVEDGLEKENALAPVHFQHVLLGRSKQENEALKLNVTYQLLLLVGHAILMD
jgi:hypothetical protein